MHEQESKRFFKKQITLGIDASNLRAGGGLTHISQLLSNVYPRENGIERVVVWGANQTLGKLPERTWLDKIHVPILNGLLPQRIWWQQLMLPKLLKRNSCNLLFSPGGTLPWRVSVPSLVMSQNLLPFERKEAALYSRTSLTWLRRAVLRKAQIRSMSNAEGVIFLSQYARDVILPVLPRRPKKSIIIPHGIEQRFFLKPRPALPLSDFSCARPFRLLYVSIINLYKHQWQVARAVSALRQKGLPVAVDFVGPVYPPALKVLQKTMKELDPRSEFLRYKGNVSFEQLHIIYQQADAFVFASSCENLPNTLLEAMAAGLPIACSNRGPMPEVLGDTGVYFDPEQPEQIADSINRLLESPQLRERCALSAFKRAQCYSWARCAKETFSFLAKVRKEWIN